MSAITSTLYTVIAFFCSGGRVNDKSYLYRPLKGWSHYVVLAGYHITITVIGHLVYPCLCT